MIEEIKRQLAIQEAVRAFEGTGIAPQHAIKTYIWYGSKDGVHWYQISGQTKNIIDEHVIRKCNLSHIRLYTIYTTSNEHFVSVGADIEVLYE